MSEYKIPLSNLAGGPVQLVTVSRKGSDVRIGLNGSYVHVRYLDTEEWFQIRHHLSLLINQETA